MRKKILLSIITSLIIIACFFSQAFATDDTDEVNKNIGILFNAQQSVAYKELNASRITLADGQVIEEIETQVIGLEKKIVEQRKIKNADIVFVLDESGSMSDKYEELSRAAQRLVDDLTSDDAFGQENGISENLDIAIVKYSSDVTWMADFSKDIQAIKSNLNINPNGGTSTEKGLEMARNMLKNKVDEDDDVVKFVMSITDGAPNNPDETIEELKKVVEDGYIPITVMVDAGFSSAYGTPDNPSVEGSYIFYSNTSSSEIIPKEVYEKLTTITKYAIEKLETIEKSNNVICVNNGFASTIDAELLYGATLEFEYIIAIVTADELTDITIKDIKTDNLRFNLNEKMLTENSVNSDYGWNINESGDLYCHIDKIEKDTKKEIKLKLSTVITPDNNSTIGNKAYIVQYTDSEGNKEAPIDAIYAKDFIILPPFGETRSCGEWVIYALIINVCLGILLIILNIRLKNKIKR